MLLNQRFSLAIKRILYTIKVPQRNVNSEAAYPLKIRRAMKREGFTTRPDALPRKVKSEIRVGGAYETALDEGGRRQWQNKKSVSV